MRIFSILAVEAFKDAARRRIVPVILAVTLVSLLAVDSCTSCSSGVQLNSSADITNWLAMLLFATVALWTMVLAGVLASDHLVETLEDGSANLILARPVRRREFALARLAGALGIAYVAGGVMLAGTAYLVHLRLGVSLAAAAWAGLACAAGSLVVAALAMSLSLVLTRIATALIVLVSVAAITFANSLLLFGAEFSGIGIFVLHFTPPLCTAIVVALAPWIFPVVPAIDPMIMCLKLVFWMGVSVLVLLGLFRREEFGR